MLMAIADMLPHRRYARYLSEPTDLICLTSLRILISVTLIESATSYFYISRPEMTFIISLSAAPNYFYR